MINFYRLSSRLLVSLFFILATVQTIFDLQDIFEISLDINIFIYFGLLSFIPIGIILFMMSYSSLKTERVRVLVVQEIRSLIKIYNYFIIFSFLLLWSIIVVLAIGLFVDIDVVISLSLFSGFILNRLFYSSIYAILIISFFYGLSDINKIIRRLKESNEV